MFENKLDSKYHIHYTRWIMSWIREGGNCKDHEGFKAWLRTLKIPESEITDMWEMMSNGKLEIETSAKKFLKALLLGQISREELEG